MSSIVQESGARPAGAKEFPLTNLHPPPVQERRDHAGRERLARRVVSEYTQMPGLRLTVAQARRLFGLEQPACERLLQRLVDAGFLARTRAGHFVRRDVTA